LGIPFPSACDPQVLLKKEYNNSRIKHQKLLKSTIRNSTASQSLSTTTPTGCGFHLSQSLSLSQSQSHLFQSLSQPLQSCSSSSSAAVMSGDEWYTQQAFRAANQAVGRCIRHKTDYGCVVLVDERYGRDDYERQLPK